MKGGKVMKFMAERKLRLVKLNEFVSKKGNKCVFLTLADPVSLESIQAMPSLDFDVSTLVTGKDYDVLLNYDGRFTSVELNYGK